MSLVPRSSLIRASIGGVLLVAALGIALLVLPDASDQARQKRKAAQEAQLALDRQVKTLGELQDLADRLRHSRERLDNLLGQLPQEGTGSLNWRLSQRLDKLAKENGIRLQTVKYGTPSREGSKGTELEAMEVEFIALGVYASLKPFMLALEGSDLPFAVASARLEESPEGGRLTVTLRAFRRATPGSQATGGQEA